MTKLSKLYLSILKFSGLDADANGFISTVINNNREPAMINGARMVMPTESHLKSANPTEKVIFHPLSENILRGESEVIQKLNEVINIRLNFTFGIVAQSLLNLVDSPELHKRLSAQQLELLIAIKEVDGTTLTNFISVMCAGIKSQPTKVFSNVFLNRGGSLHGKRYSRVGVVTFPLYKELQTNADTLFGVKVRVKDKETFKQLYKFIFPKVEERDAYSYGSDSNTAPYLDVLMKSSIGLACQLNDLLVNFKDFIEDAESLMFSDEWVEDFENLDLLIPEIRRIPNQAGNEGKSKINEVVGQAAHKVVRPEMPSQVSAPLPVPVVQAPPPPQQPAVQYQQPPAMYGHQGYPQQQQPQMPPPPQGLVKTEKGLSFNSMMATNPALAGIPSPMMYAQPGYAQPGYPQPGYPQQPPPPRWAAPDQMAPPPGYPQPGYPSPGYPQMMPPPGYPQPGYPQQGYMR